MTRDSTPLTAHPGHPTETFRAPIIDKPYVEREWIDAVGVSKARCRSTVRIGSDT